MQLLTSSILLLLSSLVLLASPISAISVSPGAKKSIVEPLGFAPILDEVVWGHFESKSLVVFKTLKLNWMQADQKCKTHGMELVSFDSKQELAYLESLIKSATAPVSVGSRSIWAWVSASDLYSEGTFTWLHTGKPFWPSFFAPPQPDNYNGNENCVEIGSGSDGKGPFTANDFTCGEKLPVVCQISFS